VAVPQLVEALAFQQRLDPALKFLSLDSVQQRLVFQAGHDGLCTKTGLIADQLLSR
jgi:hypothetical protein